MTGYPIDSAALFRVIVLSKSGRSLSLTQGSSVGDHRLSWLIGPRTPPLIGLPQRSKGTGQSGEALMMTPVGRPKAGMPPDIQIASMPRIPVRACSPRARRGPVP